MAEAGGRPPSRHATWAASTRSFASTANRRRPCRGNRRQADRHHRGLAGDCDAIMVSDYAKGALTDRVLAAAIAAGEGGRCR